MNNRSTENISSTCHGTRFVKPCLAIGRNIVVIIDNAIAAELRMSEETYVEEEITQDGILLRVKHKSKGDVD